MYKERAATEILWRTVFPGDFALCLESLVASSISMTSTVLSYFVHSTGDSSERVPLRTLDEFRSWLLDEKTDMMGFVQLRDRSYTTYQRSIKIRMLAISVGQARMILRCYEGMDYPYGREVNGFFGWLTTGRKDGAQRTITDVLRSEFHRNIQAHQGEPKSSAPDEDSDSATNRSEEQVELAAMIDNSDQSIPEGELHSEFQHLQSRMLELTSDLSVLWRYECSPYEFEHIPNQDENPVIRLNDEFELVLLASDRSLRIGLLMDEAKELSRLHRIVMQRLGKTSAFLLATALEASADVPESQAKSIGKP